MRVLVGVAVLMLAGCQGTPSEPVIGPSGQALQETKCSRSPNACYNEAAKACGGPYQVLDSSSNSGGLVADVLPGPVTWYRFSYRCGPSDGQLPSFPFRGQQYRPAPVVIQQTRPTTTNCSTFGTSVTCNSY